ncbi:uncharacterized protein LOC113306807 [Papaver somniferum]|uniref:uncharacterized protein LOC113306807 n=1 Tax=Papaver somniferum TaxID=3469 RepID=UPI000E70311E|nr:uncharacterized protein LOC113306807 [Papaver somniferum]XP_026411512.1 uncharacterized protein LOC113306807 [Papaver somniferum]
MGMFSVQGLAHNQKSASKFLEDEEESGEEERSGSSGDARSTSESSTKSSSSESVDESGGTVSEDGPEVETHHGEDVALTPTVEAAPAGDLEMEVEDIAANQMVQSTSVTVGAIVVRNPPPVTDSVACAIFSLHIWFLFQIMC